MENIEEFLESFRAPRMGKILFNKKFFFQIFRWRLFC